MKASFDGARKNLARAFNGMARTTLSPEQLDPMNQLKSAVGALLAMYDPTDDKDCHDLSESVTLVELGD